MRFWNFGAVMTAVALATTVAAQTMSPDDVDKLPASAPTLTSAYGSDANQSGDLRLPAGKGPFPVVIVVHGGCWTKGYATRRSTAALASALTAKGFATWNIDYRMLGGGGGWPTTFQDWAAATDHLRTLAKTQPLDLTRVAVTGHSAGAHAALWIAARSRLPKASAIRGADPLPIRAAVAIDGPGDLAPFIGFDAQVCGMPVIVPLMGGTPAAVPQRYAEGTPAALLPLGVAQGLVASEVLQPAAAEAYRATAAGKGDSVAVLNVSNGGHFDIIAPGSTAWTQVEPFLVKALTVPAK